MVNQKLYKLFEINNFGLSILCFHSIGGGYPFSLNIFDFQNIILELKKDYLFITPSQFDYFYQNNSKIKNNCILLTFDDGFKDNLLVADFLTKLDIKAIFFVNGLLLERNTKFLDVFIKDRNINFTFNDFLTIEDLIVIKDLGHEIGNHFYSHILLDDNLFSEVYLSNKIFAKYKFNSRFYALPYGRIELYKFSEIQKLANLGMIIFSMDPKNIKTFGFKLICIPRIGIGLPDVLSNIYKSKIRGSHRFRSLFKGSFKSL